ncbi:hypothetical protein NEPAR06_0065 [Nematocida parisii]|uniref:Uncharacterized protein n=1 Tax=Nematocida parisii (strain ERTm3) TaxID=935791 RepID=I3EE34_NEMP3|nr:uncharacterized protein NEPG_00083 [Nematocida parisii ERTm1]EIJ87481.1 hypothetical protein NEQG_02362 [Nematocida parisii ERTm3]KAI5142755.1 hypothetical protein NEPAR07_0281 [Nematocida parisii]EIJ94561.1 hypothetical protein NEPG_00083 [Nematocida parisii ERTm1]KAI5152944.1 hypothetical protein NEPAR06_0065 [Nematocida parisii]KAI5157290.1 hypothetical protein NEPAR05_1155 [Nematocida parisii]|eukprot:XP_013057917.1 hypothetical protein NEPG_00083 [Nematocida parisii ERTm1]
MNNERNDDRTHKDTMLEWMPTKALEIAWYFFYFVIRLTPYIALLSSTVILYNFFWGGIPVTDDIKYIFVGKSNFMYRIFLLLTIANFFSSIFWIGVLSMIFGGIFSILRPDSEDKKSSVLFNIAKIAVIILIGIMIGKKVYYSNLMTLYGIATAYRCISVFVTLLSWLISCIVYMDFASSIFWDCSILNIICNWHYVYIIFDIVAMVILYMASDALVNASSPDYMKIVVSEVNKV